MSKVARIFEARLWPEQWDAAIGAALAGVLALGLAFLSGVSRTDGSRLESELGQLGGYALGFGLLCQVPGLARGTAAARRRAAVLYLACALSWLAWTRDLGLLPLGCLWFAYGLWRSSDSQAGQQRRHRRA